MALDSTMAAGLLSPSLRTFVAVQISLPTGTIRLINGSGVVTFLGVTFGGKDPIGGTLKSLSSISESLATEAPRVQIGLYPPSVGAIADIAAVNAQGSPVMIWFGLVNPINGAVIGQPTLRFRGMTDVMREMATENERYVEIDCGTVFDRMFIGNEAARWIDSEHQAVWPGEDGCAHTAKAVNFPQWGTEPSKK
jgi:hypothetical protein